MTSLAAAPAFAQETTPVRFGDARQLVISNDATVAALATTVGSTTSTAIALAPSADYFAIPELSLGGQLIYEHLDPGSNSVTSNAYGIGARIGYNISFSDVVSLWARVSLSYLNETLSGLPGVATGTNEVLFFPTTASRTTLGFFAPVLIHPTTHFFLGLGPQVTTDLTATFDKTTTYGVNFVLGGWVGL